MNSKSIAAIAVVVVIIIAAVCAIALSGGDGSGDDRQTTGSVTVTDAGGREVTVDLPVEKVAILEPTALELFAGAVGGGWADYIVMVTEDILTREPTKWNMMQEIYPVLKDVIVKGDIFGTYTLPSEDILSSGATLALVSDATIGYLPGVETQIEALEKAGVSVLYVGFYNKAFDEGIAERNYGAIGKIMGTESTAQKCIDFYEEKVDYAKSKLTSTKDYTYYVEIPSGDVSRYGSVVSMGTPEFAILGGTNICDDPSGQDSNWNIEKMQRPDGDGPDHIFIVSSGYYGSESILGHAVKDTEAESQRLLEDIVSRSGWSDLKAVKEGNVYLVYGELRNSAFVLVDLYDAASVIYPDLFSQEDVADVIEGLDSITPFGFSGTWMYKYRV